MTASAPVIAVVHDGQGLAPWQERSVALLRERGATVLPAGEADPVTPVDVVLDFAPDGRAPAGAPPARHGVWYFSHDLAARHGRVLGRDEVAAGAPTTEASLLSTSGETVRTARYKTDFRSWRATRDAVLADCARWPAELCARLDAPEGPCPHGAPACPAPPRAGRVAALRVPARQLAHRFDDSVLGAIRHGKWTIGVVRRPLERAIDGGGIGDAVWLDAEPGSYIADPFTIQVSGETHLFFEHFEYGTGRGRIAHAPLEERPFAPTIVLDGDVHLSYPQVFEHRGELFMIPESCESREVVLYRAAPFPHRWERAATLLSDVPAVDPTVFEHDGRWWMLATRADEGQNLKLYGWHAPDLLGPWEEHAANPLKIDITSSRPAGAVFVRDGALHRPAQDCSRTYGGAVSVQRIVELSTTRFEEEPVTTIAPDARGPFPVGLHTLSSVDGVTLIDGKTWTISSQALRRRLRTRLARRRPTSLEPPETTA